mmetsp:Transcript_14087/g.44829  ORF Transcript_14087/g.44829 Transcript_14087/m.44829 type:complete len:344 (-) Transcript_14087:164-1195(-)
MAGSRGDISTSTSGAMIPFMAPAISSAGPSCSTYSSVSDANPHAAITTLTLFTFRRASVCRSSRAPLVHSLQMSSLTSWHNGSIAPCLVTRSRLWGCCPMSERAAHAHTRWPSGDPLAMCWTRSGTAPEAAASIFPGSSGTRRAITRSAHSRGSGFPSSSTRTMRSSDACRTGRTSLGRPEASLHKADPAARNSSSRPQRRVRASTGTAPASTICARAATLPAASIPSVPAATSCVLTFPLASILTSELMALLGAAFMDCCEFPVKSHCIVLSAIAAVYCPIGLLRQRMSTREGIAPSALSSLLATYAKSFTTVAARPRTASSSKRRMRQRGGMAPARTIGAL